MSLTLNIGRNYSDFNKVDKNVSIVRSCTAVLKDDTSIINPTFIVNTFSGFNTCNYVECSQFGRKYYINNITALPGGRLALSCHVDVLSTFAPQIRAASAIIIKQQYDNLSNQYIDDGSYVIECRDTVQCYQFSGGFANNANILITAGG